MIIDTAGNIIYEPIYCNCGITGGCGLCRPIIMQTPMEFSQIKVGDLILTNGSYKINKSNFICGTVSCIHPTHLCLKNYGNFNLPEFPNSGKLDGFENMGAGCNRAWQADNFFDTKYYKITNGEDYILIIKPTKNMLNQITNKIKRFFNKEQRTLYKAGYITECFDLTTEGQAELNAIVREKFMEKLVKSAEEKIAEEENKKK